MNGCYIFSIPRTGSHLLISLLEVLGYEEVPNRGTPVDTALHYPSPEGKVIHGGHIPPNPDYFAALRAAGFVPIVMDRNPKDVVVSYAHYIQKSIRLARNPDSNMSPDILERNLFSHFVDKSIEESISLCIQGIEGGLLSIREWYDKFYLLDEDLTLPSHNIPILVYEELLSNPLLALRPLAERLDIELDPSKELDLNSVVGKGKPFFFWKGKTNSWKEYFTEEHIELFDKVWRGE